MDNTLMTILMIVFGSLCVVGIITGLILKKAKAPENAVTITFLSASFCALIAAGMLVFVVSVNMMKDFVNIKQYHEFTLENEDKTLSLTVKEYAAYENCGFELYLKGQDKILSDIKTDGYLPFSSNEYLTEWNDQSVTIFYTDKNREDSYRSMEITVSFPDGKVSAPKDSDKDLRPSQTSDTLSSAA